MSAKGAACGDAAGESEAVGSRISASDSGELMMMSIVSGNLISVSNFSFESIGLSLIFSVIGLSPSLSCSRVTLLFGGGCGASAEGAILMRMVFRFFP